MHLKTTSLSCIVAGALFGLCQADTQQHVLTQPMTQHAVDPSVLEALKLHDDPVDAMLYLHPEKADQLNAPRLLQVFGDSNGPQWMTEGDKLRLKRKGRKFMDVTDNQDLLKDPQVGTLAGRAHLPKLVHQDYVEGLKVKVSTERMHKAITHLSSFYTRAYFSDHGERSAQWLHDRIAQIIARAPFRTRISLSYHGHTFVQPSIIARFEPKVANASAPLTIIGAHQDSLNYLFPLLPAPGADDDGSGSVSILEAFEILASSGYVPFNGPVEFHWYAAEEGGLLGSQAIAKYKRQTNTRIGAMMEFDMTAFIARNATEGMYLVDTQADESLTKWVAKLAKEYISLPVEIVGLGPLAGSDYMSFTQQGYPSAFATEGDPLKGGFPGDFDPYVHTEEDKMDIDNERGYFSIDHMARFTELALAFAVEQASWDVSR